jgi:hypothetical protein
MNHLEITKDPQKWKTRASNLEHHEHGPLVPIEKIFFVSDLHQTWYSEPDFHDKQNLFYEIF